MAEGEDRPLRIGEVAERAGVSRRTVDFYTTLGLIAPVARTPGNYRLYPTDVVDQIRTIQRLEAQGVSLDQIATADAGTLDDVERTLKLIDQELHALRKATRSVPAAAPPELVAALAAVAQRLRSIVEAGLEITAGSSAPPI